METLYARLNANHSEFFVTRLSSKIGRMIVVGKPHPTIEKANKAAALADRGGKLMHFVDSVRPQ